MEIESVNRTIKQIVNDSDARSRKSNQLHTGHKLSNLNDTETSQSKVGTNQQKTFIVEDSIEKILRGGDSAIGLNLLLL